MVLIPALCLDYNVEFTFQLGVFLVYEVGCVVTGRNEKMHRTMPAHTHSLIRTRSFHKSRDLAGSLIHDLDARALTPTHFLFLSFSLTHTHSFSC
jgi:hypothetical protein